MSTDIILSMSERAIQILEEDAHKIQKLIEVQMEHLAPPKCPVYEEVLDTQMYGFSREIDFAVRAGLVSREVGKRIIAQLEQNLSSLYGEMEKL